MRKRDYHKEWLKTKSRLSVRKNFLIIKLGGKCQECGSIKELELHHHDGKDWNPAKMSPQMRMKKYEEDNENGQISLLCHKCNCRDGALNQKFYSAKRNGEDIPF